MLDTSKALFLCAFVLLTVPFALVAHKASTIIAQIEQDIGQIAQVE